MENCKCIIDTENNENEILLNQIKREIKKLTDTGEAKFLMQDKKIAELCVYLKDNLSNSIRSLIDTMVETGEIDEIISSIVTELNNGMEEVKTLVSPKMKFYLPSGMNYSYGQFTLLGVTDTKACLFDLGLLDDADYNVNYFKNILKGKPVDYVFISHYHADHVTGLSKFKSLFTKATKFYIAMNPQNYYSGSEAANAIRQRNDVVNYLETNRYKYYEVNEVMNIILEKNVTLTLLNNSKDAFSYYKDSGTDNYNNYSMVIDACVQNKHVLIGFDASDLSQKYLNSMNYVNKCDVLFNFHHGNLNKCDVEYMLKLNPDYVIDTLPPSNLKDFDGTETYNGFPTYNYKWLSNARNEVVFEVNAFSVAFEKGDIKTDSIRNHGNVEVWLNTDYTGSECIGTENKPFRNFNQIFELIPKSCQSVTVNVRGAKVTTNQRFYNTFNKMIIKGDVNNKTELINLQVDNCHKFELSNLKFSENTVYIYNSDVRFTDCEFMIPKTQNVNITNSKVSFNTCSFNGATREAIYSADKSIIRLNSCNIKAPVYGVNCETTILFITNNTITGTKNFYRMYRDCEIIALKAGSTDERPNFGESYYCNGYTYFDSEINRLIYYDHDGLNSKWKTADGVDV